MMIFTGALKKMMTEYTAPIRYYLTMNEGFIEVNQLLGRALSLQHIGNECKACKLNKPIFRMGFCKNCFFTVPQANPSILKPELSTAHLGVEQRDLEWEKSFELQPHVVYLAVSGGIKVGVTRATQIPTRWIDQGATQAIIVAETQNRYQAGQIEVFLKNYFSDKTSWRKMLSNDNPMVDIEGEKKNIQELLPQELKSFYVQDSKTWGITYPLEVPLRAVNNFKFSNQEVLKGTLVGIKAQYLIFEDQTVFNVRANEGRVVSLKIY